MECRHLLNLMDTHVNNQNQHYVHRNIVPPPKQLKNSNTEPIRTGEGKRKHFAIKI